MSGVTGIVWVGPVYDRGGYGTVARNYLVGLAEIGYPVRVVNIGPEHTEIDPRARRLITGMEGASAGRLPVVVAHGTPDLHREIMAWGAARRVVMTLFETDGLPAGWAEGCNQFDEVWVPSRFNKDTFARAGVDPAKLWVVPYAIDTEVFRAEPRAPRPADRPFEFLYVFSFGWRKGFDVLLKAFLSEFRRGEARLVLRCFSEGYQGVSREEVAETLLASAGDELTTGEDRPEVEISVDAMSTEGLIELYRSCDLYISTDRGNGWGYPNMEAMALGVPSAAIDWGGGVEFMTEDNSYLLHTDDELEPVDARLAAAVPQLYGGQRWRKLRVDEVRRVMRQAVADPDLLAGRAQRGCADVHRDFNSAVVAQRIVDHVSAIEPGRGPRLRAALGVPPVTGRKPSRETLAQLVRRR